MKVVNESGDLIQDVKSVLDRWESDFSNLFAGNNAEGVFDDDFFKEICALKHRLENEMKDVSYSPNPFLNAQITLSEVTAAVEAAKTGKAMATTVLAEAAGRALGGVLGKVKGTWAGRPVK
ncbi:hypothetical protein Bbelb_041510 [Branchiostoma belcheri]|nr:hypothetical protein Bbelb_041510 [Branchiostoma belcheri]